MNGINKYLAVKKLIAFNFSEVAKSDNTPRIPHPLNLSLFRWPKNSFETKIFHR